MKLEIRCPFELHMADIRILLRDGTSLEDDKADESFKIESLKDYKENGSWLVEAELKLERVSKQLQFVVQMNSMGTLMEESSVTFGAHNNGKTRFDCIFSGSPRTEKIRITAHPVKIPLLRIFLQVPKEAPKGTKENLLPIQLQRH